MANIKVAVRVRPISAREINVTGSEVIVRTDVKEISLTNLKVSSSKAGDSRERTRKYGFDYCFDSSTPEAENYADQTAIYDTLGQPVLDALFSGYHTCLVAYGQSASGKTYTMMGPKDNPGLTPRLCEGLFSRIEEEKTKHKFYRVSVSYLEIYNERVRDLLKPSASTTGLKVREHPRLGPYVQGLTHKAVDTLGSLMSYVEEGTKARKTAATLQNPSSSRSHALLTVAITSETGNPGNGGHSVAHPSTKRFESGSRGGGGSKLHLVDLAGSENAATCSGVHRLKEGANINKSLVALGNVISALAERGSSGNASSRRRFIPYRDSSLTWLLKDALGGNATTIMLATISPASGSYNETAHTLRFAQRAQSVVNRPIVNEDPVARIIRELRAEVARLKSLLSEKNINFEQKSICCCKYNQRTEEPDDKELRKEEIITNEEQSNNEDKAENTLRKTDNYSRSIKKSNSCEFAQDHKYTPPQLIKKASSYEFLLPNIGLHRYKHAKITELKGENEEVIDETIEPGFVDIPTLVAVLIKPDNNTQIGSAQIEEICNDEVLEDLAEGDFLESINNHEITGDVTKPSLFEDPVGVHQESFTDDIRERIEVKEGLSVGYSNGFENVVSHGRYPNNESRKFQKQDSIDAASPTNLSNLTDLKKFGSLDGLQKKPPPSLERAHTTLEKRSIILDKVKKLNNIKEGEDQRLADGSKLGSVWRTTSNASSRENLYRKGSNDSDRSSKDSCNTTGFKAKILPRKTSLDGLKRKTSKDSSSSSSKDEQILFSNLTRDKLLRRKNSLDQDTSTVRTHTPIQRPNRRAQIVAAVTQRLYTNRKLGDDLSGSTGSVSGIRTPPDVDADTKTPNLVARMKLQDISRKMLGKRRRTCVDTQTDDQTLRVKDAMTLTDEPKITSQEIGILTDYHEGCQDVVHRDDIPVLRVKEVATSTDNRPNIKIVRCKDVECFVNDLDDEDYSSRNDSGILSDDTQNYAESNFSSAETSDLCPESDKRITCAESSTNTVHLSSPKNMGVQTQRQGMKVAEEEQMKFFCGRPCCKPTAPLQNTPQNFFLGPAPSVSEKNVISISVPDTISITIESPNLLESKVTLSGSSDVSEEKSKPITRDSQMQTEKTIFVDHNDGCRCCFKDISMRTAIVQTDGKTFRIENIFQDPKTTHSVHSGEKAVVDRSATKKSITFTNSLGTSIPTAQEIVTDISTGTMSEQGNDNRNVTPEQNVISTGLITTVFVSRRGGTLPTKSYQRMINDTPSYLHLTPATKIAENTRLGEKVNNIVIGENDVVDNMIFGKNVFFANAIYSMPASKDICAPKTVNLVSDNERDLMKLPSTQPTYSCTSLLDNSCNEKSAVHRNSGQLVTIFESPNHLEMDHSFSDDSLDFNQDTSVKEDCTEESMEDSKHKIYCPPDVVAHTKKDASKSCNEKVSNITEITMAKDFEDSQIEFPRMKPVNPVNSAPPSIHDYESLILGKPFANVNQETFQGNSDSDVTMMGDSSGMARKKVSFSNVNVKDEKKQSNDFVGSTDEITENSALPKSIIKKQNFVVEDRSDITESSNDEVDNGSRYQTGLFSVSDSSPKLPKDNFSVPEDNHLDHESDDYHKNAGGSRCKKVRFTKKTPVELSGSDSNSYDINVSEEGDEEERAEFDGEEEGTEEEEGDHNPIKTKDDVVQEYLVEAVKFMRNMNSINEYMNAKHMLHTRLGSGRRRKHRRRKCPWRDNGYVDYRGQRISLKADENQYSDNDNEDILIPTKSYERCLQGIARFEACINEVSRHNDHLRDKYGIDVESADAKVVLASSSTDSELQRSKREVPILPGNEPVVFDEIASGSDSRNTRLTLRQRPGRALTTKDLKRNAILITDELDNENNNVNSKHNDDLERKIFDQLMSVANSVEYRNNKKYRFNSALRLSNVQPDNSMTYSKLRGNHNYTQNQSSFYESHTFSDSDEDFQNEDYCNKASYMKSCSREISGYRVPSKLSDSTRYIRTRQSSALGLSKQDLNLSPCLPMTLNKRSCLSSTETRARVRPTRRDLQLRIEKSSSTDTVTTSTESCDGTWRNRERPRLPGSPRARFLELLSERRRIVESSRNANAS